MFQHKLTLELRHHTDEQIMRCWASWAQRREGYAIPLYSPFKFLVVWDSSGSYFSGWP